MVERTTRKKNEVDARELRVEFSPAVQDAFRAIAVAASKSKHFDDGIYEIAKNWSMGKPTTVHDVMIALPSIASEVSEHLIAINDTAMKQAWDDLCAQLPENGFKVSQSLQRRR